MSRRASGPLKGVSRRHAVRVPCLAPRAGAEAPLRELCSASESFAKCFTSGGSERTIPASTRGCLAREGINGLMATRRDHKDSTRERDHVRGAKGARFAWSRPRASLVLWFVLPRFDQQHEFTEVERSDLI